MKVRTWIFIIASLATTLAGPAFATNPKCGLQEALEEFKALGAKVVRVDFPDGSSSQLIGTTGVYSPDADSAGSKYGKALMAAALPKITPQTKRILVLGSGTGFDAIAMAKASAAQVDASDVLNEAVLVGRKNAELEGLSDRIHFVESDLYNSVPGKYDLIVFNAPRPILWELVKDLKGSKTGQQMTELKFQELQTRAENERAYLDPRGELLMRTLRETPQHLNPGGKLLIMSDSGLERVMIPGLTATPASPLIPWHTEESAQSEGYFRIFEVQVRTP